MVSVEELSAKGRIAPAHVHSPLVVPCASEADVVSAIGQAAGAGIRAVPRGGGHCLVERSSGDRIVLELSALDCISVNGAGEAVIGAGARLGAVYRALHAAGRTLPGGCGNTVGIAGLTLGGGIGLLGRRFGLTCDRLLAARVVLADRKVVVCDERREPDLFWALRGAGGGQFGVVTAFRFATVPEPLTTRIEMGWPGVDLARLIAAWQDWAPDAPDGLTLDLAIDNDPGIGAPYARAFGVSILPRPQTIACLQEFFSAVDARPELQVSAPIPFSAVKEALADDARSSEVRPVRLRSEFFTHTMAPGTIDAILDGLSRGRGGGMRRLAFTAMGGAYNRVPEDATAFAHRGERFLLEHVGARHDEWIDVSWAIAHQDGSERVYPNFPDLLLDDPLGAYHGGNGPRLAEIKERYDPGRFFDFPQAIRPAVSARRRLSRYPDRNEVRS